MDDTAAMKEWIARASYEALLERWRNAPAGSPWFCGEVGQYYQDTMASRRKEDPTEHVRASKRIGWD